MTVTVSAVANATVQTLPVASIDTLSPLKVWMQKAKERERISSVCGAADSSAELFALAMLVDRPRGALGATVCEAGVSDALGAAVRVAASDCDAPEPVRLVHLFHALSVCSEGRQRRRLA